MVVHKNRDKCIFCLGSPLSKEHMWADWLREYVDSAMLSHDMRTALTFAAEERAKRTIRTGDPHSRKIRRVCRFCNNGWMSRLQENAKETLVPILMGKHLTLRRIHQRTLASWAAMTVMVAEFVHPSDVAIAHSDRTWLKKELRAPSHWQIWMVRCKPPSEPPLYHHNSFPFGDSLEDAQLGPFSHDPFIEDANTQATTMRFGDHLVVHAVSSAHRRGRDQIRRWVPPDNLSNAMIRVWPFDRTTKWPPTGALDAGQVEELADFLFRAAHRSIGPETPYVAH